MDRSGGRNRHIGGTTSGPSRRGGGLSGGSSFGGGNRGGNMRFSGGRRYYRGRGPRIGGLGIVVIVVLYLLYRGGSAVISGLFGGGSTVIPSLFGSDTSSELGSDGIYGSEWSYGTGWDYGNNTGKLNTTVEQESRDKYTKIKGNGCKTTVMVYMCGTDLESRSGMASNDIREICDATLSKDVNVYIYTGGCTKWRTKGISSKNNQVFQVKKGKLKCVEVDKGSKSMTDPSTLSAASRL